MNILDFKIKNFSNKDKRYINSKFYFKPHPLTNNEKINIKRKNYFNIK